jgi:hypothetical protein
MNCIIAGQRRFDPIKKAIAAFKLREKHQEFVLHYVESECMLFR